MNEAFGERTIGSIGAETIKVAIIEDIRTLRDGLSALIDGTAGFQCTGRFRSAEEAIERLRDDLPHVVLADIGLPGMSGIEAVRLLKERFPALTLLMLTVYDDDDRVFEALCAGATAVHPQSPQPSQPNQQRVRPAAIISPEVQNDGHVIFQLRTTNEGSDAAGRMGRRGRDRCLASRCHDAR